MERNRNPRSPEGLQAQRARCQKQAACVAERYQGGCYHGNRSCLGVPNAGITAVHHHTWPHQALHMNQPALHILSTYNCSMKFSKQLAQALPTGTLQIQPRARYPGVGAQAIELSTPEAETGGWKIRGQPGLHGNTLSEKQKQKNKLLA